MSFNFLKRVVEDVVEGSSQELVDLLLNKKDVNEFIIAKKLGLTINQTRNLLYKFSNMGILNSVRKKDKRKGWYIYFWTLDLLKSLEILEKKLQDELNELERELSKRQQERFYKCKICGLELNEESALLSDFTCKECGEIYGLSNSQLHLEDITKKIVKLKRELHLASEERKKEKEKEDKKFSNTLKRHERDKKKKRMENRKKMQKEKAKLSKALLKKSKPKLKKKKSKKS